MQDKIKINKAVIVEGKYDKIKLDSIIDGLVIATGGFRIYKDKEKAAMLRAVAQKQGVIILTDSDRAGFKIRSYLKSVLAGADITELYIPRKEGKEPRKKIPGREGLLGVEGMDDKTIRELFLPCISEKASNGGRSITRLDFYEDGLTGGKNSHNVRMRLALAMGLPPYLSSGGLLEIINSLISYEEYKTLLEQVKGE